MADNAPLNAEQMEERLDEFLDPVLSSRRTAAAPARELAHLDRERQEFVLHWVAVIAKTNAELSFQFAAFASKAMGRMDLDGVHGWLIQAMDAYDTKGLMQAIACLRAVEAFACDRNQRVSGLALEDVSTILEHFVQGLSGRALRLEAGQETYTDTEAMAVHQWAQTWYGTWRGDIAAKLVRYPDPELALRLFHSSETLRLDALIVRDLPGLHRDMQALRADLDPPSEQGRRVLLRDRLQGLEAGIQCTLDLAG